MNVGKPLLSSKIARGAYKHLAQRTSIGQGVQWDWCTFYVLIFSNKAENQEDFPLYTTSIGEILEILNLKKCICGIGEEETEPT